MPKYISAGLLMFTRSGGNLKVFLVHPGGPFFKKKDEGYWSIPKGLQEDGEDLLAAAKREFEEETGIIPEPEYIPLGEIEQKNNKKVYAWAFEGKPEAPSEIKCNTFEMEWPPKSGKKQSFPEVDRGAYFSLEMAKVKINKSQIEFITRLLNNLNAGSK